MQKALSKNRKNLIINCISAVFLLVFLFSAIYFQVYLLPELETPFPSQESVEQALNTSDARKLKKFILMVNETNGEVQRDLVKMINTMFFAFYGVLIVALTIIFTCSQSIAKLNNITETYDKSH